MTRSKDALPATVVAPLLGISVPHTRRLLKKARTELGSSGLSLKELGNLIYEYRLSREQKSVEHLLRRWTGPD